MKLHTFLLLLLLTNANSLITAQTNCTNSDLGTGTFLNWTGTSGTYNNPYINNGLVASQHFIETPGNDLSVGCINLPKTPPGESFSARVGDYLGNGSNNSLSYSLIVDSSNALFIYKYSVVLEDGGHTPSNQPTFNIDLTTANNTPISGCGTYSVYAGQPGQNFISCGARSISNWTTVAVNLLPYYGQLVKIRFTVRDCAPGAHESYARIWATCRPLTLNTVACPNQPAIITAPDGFQSYNWSTGQTTQSIVINSPQQSDTITCTMSTFSNLGNCQVTVSTILNIQNASNSFLSNTNCPGDSSLFTVNVPQGMGNSNYSSYNWDFGDGNSSSNQNPSHVYNSPGSYLVQLTTQDDNGCFATSMDSITIPTPEQNNFLIQNSCFGEQISLSTSLSNPNIGSYNWLIDGISYATSQDTLVNGLNPGNYTISLISTDINSCKDTSSQTLIVYNLPVITANNDTTVCPGTSLNLIENGGTNYSWSDNLLNGQNVTVTNPNTWVLTGIDMNGCQNTDTFNVSIYAVTLIDAGPDVSLCYGDSLLLNVNGQTVVWSNGSANNTYLTPVSSINLSVQNTDNNGCISNDTLNIIVNPNPIVDAGNDTLICQNGIAVLSGYGATNYIWSNGIQNNIPFVPNTNTTYAVIGTDQNGCQGTDSVQVSIENSPTINVTSSPSGCLPLETTFTSSNTDNVSNYSWYINDNPYDNDTSNFSVVFNEPGCYTVKLELTSNIGCLYDQTFPNIVCAYQLPIANFDSPSSVSEINNNVAFTNSSTGNTNNIWDFGDGSAFNYDENPTHEFDPNISESFTIYLIVENEFGCRDTASRSLILIPEILVFTPNSFTPDGDEFNNEFLPVVSRTEAVQEFHFTMYNRWGEVIFESFSLEQGWKGDYQGHIVAPGTYIWTLVLSDKYGKRQELNGHVNLIN